MHNFISLGIDYEQISSILAKKIAEKLEDYISPTQQAVERKRIDGIRGLASHIKCSVSKAQDLKNKGIIPFHEVGKRVFFYSNEVDEALKSKKGDIHGGK